MNLSLLVEATANNPTFGGIVTAPTLTVNDYSTLSWDLYVMGTDKVITAKKIQAAAASSLTVSGSVLSDSTLNVPSGGILGNATFIGTVANFTKATVGLSNVDKTTDASKPVSAATLRALGKKEDAIFV